MSRYELYMPPVRQWPGLWWANMRQLCTRYAGWFFNRQTLARMLEGSPR